MNTLPRLFRSPTPGGLGAVAGRRPRSRRLAVEGLEDRDVPTTFTVSNADDSGAGSLRQAILDANARPGADTIVFAGTGVMTIRPLSELPRIFDTVTIDGTTELGYAGTPLIELDNSQTPGYWNGLTVWADNCTIRGLVIHSFNYGIWVNYGTGNRIVGNYVGTDVSGTQARANTIGVKVEAANNSVGGTGPGDGNLVSGNFAAGIYLGLGAQFCVVEGNRVGTNAAGTAALPNTNDGVDVAEANEMIGGAAAGVGNLISGNGRYGIFFNIDRGSSNGSIQGNRIGTDASGTYAVGNIAGGVYVYNQIVDLTIGGTDSGAGNVISGNGGNGIDANGSNIQILGNYIGTDATGTHAVGNANVGLQIGDPSQTAGSGIVIGGPAVGAGNLISGNGSYGIGVYHTNPGGEVIQGNRIGSDIFGTHPLGNGGHGVYLGSGGHAIGGRGAGEGNVIAFNGGGGVAVAAGTGNVIAGNAIASNAGLGIDLGGSGVTPNDPGDADVGPNGLQNFPVLDRVMAGATHLKGTLSSSPQTTFTVDFYASPMADPSGFGEGDRYLGSAAVTTDAGGTARFSFSLLAPLAAGDVVTATATDPAGSTSEFSAGVTAIEVETDVLPDDPANAFDLNSAGPLAVAVLTTPDFDAATIDTSDLSRTRFGDASGSARVSPIRETLGDVDGDGDLDRVFVFSIPAVRRSGALTASSTMAVLAGVTFDGGPWSGRDPVTVQLVNTAPVVTAGPGLTVNQGEVVTVTPADLSAVDPEGSPVTYVLTAGPAHGLLRVGGNPVTTFTQADIDAGRLEYAHDGSRTTADAFTITAGDGGLDSDPVTIGIAITTAPLVTVQPIDRSAVAGATVTFAAAADGNLAPAVRWQVSTDGGASFRDLAGAADPILSFKALSSQDGDMFRAVFTNAAGTATTDSAALTVRPGLAVVSDPVSRTVPVGSTATFTAAATGVTRPQVQWEVSADGGATFANIPGAVGLKYRVKALATVDGNLYRAVFTNAAGTAATAAAALTVNFSLNVEGLPKALSVPVGAAVSLTGVVSGLIAPAVQWEVSADRGTTYSAVPGATTATLSFAAGAADAGKYFRAVFTAGPRVRRTGPVALEVGDPPAVVAPPADATAPAGGMVTFGVSFAGSPVVAVQWQVSTDDGRTFTNVRGAVRPILTLNHVKSALTGVLYRVVLTNAFDQVVTPAARLTVS
jgi:hypothetical protein